GDEDRLVEGAGGELAGELLGRGVRADRQHGRALGGPVVVPQRPHRRRGRLEAEAARWAVVGIGERPVPALVRQRCHQTVAAGGTSTGSHRAAGTNVNGERRPTTSASSAAVTRRLPKRTDTGLDVTVRSNRSLAARRRR